MKIKSLLYTLIFFLFCVPQSALAGGLPVEKGTLGDVSWYVEEQVGRVFYLTHGSFVWGHEFGFFKNPNDYRNDILWLAFSSSNEEVKDFVGKEVTVSLNIDGVMLEVELEMLFTGTIGITQVMYFTNWLAGERLINTLAKGRYVEVKIVKPKKLEALLDIKFDVFNLEGFTASRKKAEKMCKDSLPDVWHEKSILAELPPKKDRGCL